MTARPITTIPPAATAVGHRHRPLRAAAAITGVAAVIAAGGYLATTTIGPDSIPTAAPTGAAVNPSAQALGELRESVAGQYGSQSAAGAAVNPTPAHSATCTEASPASTRPDPRPAPS